MLNRTLSLIRRSHAGQHRPIQTSDDTPDAELATWLYSRRGLQIEYRDATFGYQSIDWILDRYRRREPVEPSSEQAAWNSDLAEIGASNPLVMFERALQRRLDAERDRVSHSRQVDVRIIDQLGVGATYHRSDDGAHVITFPDSTTQLITRAYKYWLVYMQPWQKAYYEAANKFLPSRILFHRQIAEDVRSLFESVMNEGLVRSRAIRLGVTGVWTQGEIIMDVLAFLVLHELGHAVLHESSRPPTAELDADIFALNALVARYPNGKNPEFSNYPDLIAEAHEYHEELARRLILPPHSELPYPAMICAMARVVLSSAHAGEGSTDWRGQLVQAVSSTYGDEVVEILNAEMKNPASFIGFYATHTWEESLDLPLAPRRDAWLQWSASIVGLGTLLTRNTRTAYRRSGASLAANESRENGS